MVGLADRPLDQSRASGHLQESIRNIELHRVLDGYFDKVSYQIPWNSRAILMLELASRAWCKISTQLGETSDVSCHKTRLC
jgi:hypothetical protein